MGYPFLRSIICIGSFFPEWKREIRISLVTVKIACATEWRLAFNAPIPYRTKWISILAIGPARIEHRNAVGEEIGEAVVEHPPALRAIFRKDKAISDDGGQDQAERYAFRSKEF